MGDYIIAVYINLDNSRLIPLSSPVHDIAFLPTTVTTPMKM